MQYKDEDLIGKRFGKLVIVEMTRIREKSGRLGRYALCKCDCGNEKYVRIDALFRGDTISCTCHSKKQSSIRMKKRATIHGLSNHPLYQIWENMVDRCENSNCKNYKNYGGRGVKICPEWRKHPEQFIKFALENGWNKNLTTDRINVNGDYEPNNIRFVNRHIQSVNQRKSILNKSGYVGITWDKSRNKWVAWLSYNYKTKNIGRYETKKEALDARNNYIIENKLFEYAIQEWEGE